jgi:DNA primase
LDENDYPYYWTPRTETKFDRRVIIPFFWQGEIVGYTARLAVRGNPKYFTSTPAGYVFNMDRQTEDRKFVIVTEGPFDAIAIDGVAILGSDIGDAQVDLIESLNKQIIMMPDNDSAGNKLITQALKYNWDVSFPTWYDTCKDINEAVLNYGKIFTLKNILDNVQSTRLKIQLHQKRLQI